MSGESVDLEFPACCVTCPYQQRLSASCSHELRQSLVRELATGENCPVYTEVKTAAMRRLLEST